MALTGEPTGDPALYDEKTASRPDLVALRGKVTVGGDDSVGPNETHLTVHLSDGTVIREQRDMAIPNTDLKDQWNKLESKFRALATPLIGEANTERAIAIVAELETRDGIQELLDACSKRV
jgi:2-methylcitrate dehydratase PrpD